MLVAGGTLRTDNPHVVVTRAIETRNTPTSPVYVTHLLDPCGLQPQRLRITRIAHLAISMDPIVITEAPGMSALGLGTSALGILAYLSLDVISERGPPRADAAAEQLAGDRLHHPGDLLPVGAPRGLYRRGLQAGHVELTGVWADIHLEHTVRWRARRPLQAIRGGS
ncbi:MAG: hypothetical protein M0T80_15480, partial [Actinomycetota bacterium]|nr:hypothetical protein [Actinomycetota bacterium]